MPTLVHDREIVLSNTVSRIIATSTIIESNNGAVFLTDTLGVIVTAPITLTAVTTVFVSPSYKWYYANNADNVWVEIVGSTASTYIVTPANFELHLNGGNKVTYKVVGSEIKYLDSYGTYEIIYNNVPYIVATQTLDITKVASSATALVNKKLPVGTPRGRVEWLQMLYDGEYIAIPYLMPLTIDYVVLRFNWLTTGGGVDLDTRVSLIGTGTAYDNIQTGWCKEDMVGPTGATLANGNYYILWAGDNTETNGKEEHLINLKKIAADNPTLTEIYLNLRAFWYSARYNGDFTIEVDMYEGGIMQEDTTGLAFENVGGSLYSTTVVACNATDTGSSCKVGECVKAVEYIVATDTLNFITCFASASSFHLILDTALMPPGDSWFLKFWVFVGTGGYGEIYWGDGESTVLSAGGLNYTHEYLTAGIYDIFIDGSNVTRFSTDVIGSGEGQRGITHCVSFGNIGLTNLNLGFSDCRNLAHVPSSIPSTLTDISNLFSYCIIFNDPNIALWDTSNITNMSDVFAYAALFNQDIGSWNTSSVTNMSYMFYNAAAFNQDLSGWCVSLIPTAPSNFDTGATAWTLPKPVWGTCP